MTTSAKSVPGWYPDPANPSVQRYWDGSDWVAVAQMQSLSPVGEPARFTIHYGFALLAFFSLVGTLLFGIPMLSTASDPDLYGIGGVMGTLWMMWGGMWTLIWTAFAINHTLKSRRR